MDIHDRLIAARHAAGYETAADAARSLGVSYPTYAGHENGSSGFRHKTAVIYARRFGVSLEWLLTGNGPMKGAKQDPRLEELIDKVRAANPDVRTAIEVLLDQRTPLISAKPVPGSHSPPPSKRK